MPTLTGKSGHLPLRNRLRPFLIGYAMASVRDYTLGPARLPMQLRKYNPREAKDAHLRILDEIFCNSFLNQEPEHALDIAIQRSYLAPGSVAQEDEITEDSPAPKIRMTEEAFHGEDRREACLLNGYHRVSWVNKMRLEPVRKLVEEATIVVNADPQRKPELDLFLEQIDDESMWLVRFWDLGVWLLFASPSVFSYAYTNVRALKDLLQEDPACDTLMMYLATNTSVHRISETPQNKLVMAAKRYLTAVSDDQRSVLELILGSEQGPRISGDAYHQMLWKTSPANLDIIFRLQRFGLLAVKGTVFTPTFFEKLSSWTGGVSFPLPSALSRWSAYSCSPLAHHAAHRGPHYCAGIHCNKSDRQPTKTS